MSLDNSLLRGALSAAGLTTEAESAAFWDEALAENPNAVEVRRQYIRDRESTSVNKKVIFYETMSGARMGDNPYGIFQYLRSHPNYGDFLHVWSINDEGSVPEQYQNEPDVVFAARGTRSYTYFLASAAYVVGNANPPAYFARRAGQKYLNTWHGIPYKALGRNTPKAKFGAPASTATFTKATHVLSPCDFATQKFASAYSMRGVSTALVAEIGYPRVDRTVAPETGLKVHLRETLGLQSANTTEASNDHRPVVLYAPTWRSENAKDVVDSDQLMDDLGALAGLDIQLIYRGHHRMDRLINDASVGDQIGEVIIPPHEISSNDLLSVVDILITDFSSIFFDFLPTGLPIVHYLYDLDEYSLTRGINLSTKELPGSVAITRSELTDAVATASSNLSRYARNHDFHSEPLQGKQYKAAQARFCPHEDGHASKRAVEFMINEEIDGYRVKTVSDNKPTAAFWAGDLKANPRSEVLLQALLKSAACPFEQTVLIANRKAPVDKATMKEIKKFGDDISTFAYDNVPTLLLEEEEEAYNEFAKQYYLDFSRAKALVEADDTLKQIYSREYERRLDDAQFDRVFLASDLSHDELAMASLAGQSYTTTADQWTAPQSPAVTPKTNRRQQIIGVALPRDSARRKLMGRKYRQLRTKLRHYLR